MPPRQHYVTPWHQPRNTPRGTITRWRQGTHPTPEISIHTGISQAENESETHFKYCPLEHTHWDARVIHCKHNLFIVKRMTTKFGQKSCLLLYWWRKCQYPQTPAYKHGYIAYTLNHIVKNKNSIVFILIHSTNTNVEMPFSWKTVTALHNTWEPTASFWNQPGLGSSKVLVLGTWCKISSTWYLPVLDTLKFKSSWYLLVLEGKVLDACPSTFEYFCQINMFIEA